LSAKHKGRRDVTDLEVYFQTHPVFTLDQFRRRVGAGTSPATAQARIKYHLARGRLKLVEKGVYAVIPPGLDPKELLLDRFLVAAALRNDAILAYHSALEVLGYAHSTYRDTFFLTARRRKDLRLVDGRIRSFLHPKPLRARRAEEFGVVVRERVGVRLKVTGPERTLVDCLSAPRYGGGLEEVFQSAAGFPSLDLDVLIGYLERLGQRRLYAAAGYYLEREAKRLFVPDRFLDRLARERPTSPVYLDRGKRGGRMQARWNLIVPERWAGGQRSLEV